MEANKNILVRKYIIRVYVMFYDNVYYLSFVAIICYLHMSIMFPQCSASSFNFHVTQRNSGTDFWRTWVEWLIGWTDG